VLDRLVAEAAASNLDLKQAAYRIREARTQRTVAVSQGLPNVGFQNNVTRRYNNFAGGGTSGGGGGAGGGTGFGFPVGGGTQFFDIFQAGFDVQWEIDLFGGIRRNIEAAEAGIATEEENRRDVLVSLLGEVARLYIEMRTNQQQMAITRENLRTQEDTLGLTQARYEAGLASALEVAQQEAQAENTRSQLPLYETAVRQSAHALAVLLGKPPGALLSLTEGDAAVPVSTRGVAADLPSELLRRRPDIRRAERQLAGATARIGVATAELYPKLNLSSFAGVQNMNIGSMTPVGKSWNVASALSLPIFNWGRIRANIDAREAETKRTLLAYENTVLTAFKEVEDALVAHSREEQRLAALAQSVEASRLAVKLADERFQKGLSDFLNVLEAQRALYVAESNLVESRSRLATSLVALYKALGGGWEAMEPVAAKAAE
jgi:NodT family efflux transporter outer membrane factor (OMF) lipoprotein